MKGGGWSVLSRSLVSLLVSLGLVLVLRGVSAGVEVGDKAPDFELPSTLGARSG
jgi:hypothetical protein